MSALAAAKEFQRQDSPIEAAQAYEAAFDTEMDALSLADYLDAALLYFVCTDFGYSSYKNLPEEFARAAYARAKLWIERALLKFGRNSEIRFWELYFAFVVLGEPPFVAECRRLVATGETSIPYFYLYASTRDLRYKAKAEDLYALNKKGETAKQRYIASVLAPLLKT